MAKKDEAVVIDDDYVTRVLGEIRKDYGDGTCLSGSDVVAEKRQVIPVSPALDLALGGGFVEGCWVSISGSYKYGKSSLALAFAANCQRPEYGERHVYYFDIEGRLKQMNLEGTLGLKLDGRHLTVIRSKKDKILSSQDWLKIAVKILHTHPACVLIIDSVSALCDERELDGGVGTETRGSGAKLLTQFCGLVATVVPVQKSIVVGITHLISNTSGFGPQFVERAARRWLYQADIRLKADSIKPWRVGDAESGKQIGQSVHWTVQCSALGPPGGTAEGWIRYGIGIDRLFEAVNFGVLAGLIDKSGAWYTLAYMERYLPLLDATAWTDDVKKRVKAQGMEKLYMLLSQNPQWVQALNDEISLLAGIKR